MIKVIYWNVAGQGIEIPTDYFKEDLNGPIGLESKILEEIIEIENRSGLVYYFIELAKNVTEDGYNSVVVLNGADKSIKIIIDVSRNKSGNYLS